MSGKRYTGEFKIAAVKQVAERGHPASEVASRLGVSIHSLYAWTKRYGVPEEERKAVDSQADEMRRLKAELKRVTEERDILKKAAVLKHRVSNPEFTYRSFDATISCGRKSRHGLRQAGGAEST